jgi:hypothetical protein
LSDATDDDAIFNVFCAAKGWMLREVWDGHSSGQLASLDRTVTLGSFTYSMMDLLQSRVDTRRPWLVEARLAQEGQRQALVEANVRYSPEPSDEHSEFALGYLARHWIEQAWPQSCPGTWKSIQGLYVRRQEISALRNVRHKIAPFVVQIGESPRVSYADRTDWMLLDSDAESTFSYATARGLAGFAREMMELYSEIMESDFGWPFALDKRRFLMGVVLKPREVGYDIEDGWICGIGWGGSSFWMAQPDERIWLGYTSDLGVPDLSERASMMRAAASIARSRLQ